MSRNRGTEPGVSDNAEHRTMDVEEVLEDLFKQGLTDKEAFGAFVRQLLRDLNHDALDYLEIACGRKCPLDNGKEGKKEVDTAFDKLRGRWLDSYNATVRAFDAALARHLVVETVRERVHRFTVEVCGVPITEFVGVGEAEDSDVRG